MNKLNIPSEKFRLYIKLNKLQINILEVMGESLSVEPEKNKNNLINKIVEKLAKLKKEELKNFESIIDENIGDKKILTDEIIDTKIKDNINEALKPNKRTYLDLDIAKNEDDNKTEKEEILNTFYYEKFLKPGEKYYYVDKENKEWEFREKKGTKSKFYFICATDKCCGFGMISKEDIDKTFVLTKQHNIPYLSHSYCNLNIKNNIYKNIEFTQKDWEEEIFRIQFINWYFENNKNASEGECIAYIKAKLENKIIINEEILKKEIKKCKQYSIIKKRSKESIISQIINLKDETEQNTVMV